MLEEIEIVPCLTGAPDDAYPMGFNAIIRKHDGVIVGHQLDGFQIVLHQHGMSFINVPGKIMYGTAYDVSEKSQELNSWFGE